MIPPLKDYQQTKRAELHVIEVIGIKSYVHWFRTKWRFALLLILLATAIGFVIFSFTTRESLAWKFSFWFVAAFSCYLSLPLFLAQRNLIQRPLPLFLLWFPLLTILFFGLNVVFTLREDLYFKGQSYFLWFYGITVLTTVVMVLIYTGRIAFALIVRSAINPVKALFVVIQAYVALLLSMAIVYAIMENISLGHAFNGMSPPLSANADYYEYFRIQNLPTIQVDSFYYSVMTACTVGYGDIYPVTKLAKLAVTFHTLASQFILVALVGIIISAFSERPVSRAVSSELEIKSGQDSQA